MRGPWGRVRVAVALICAAAMAAAASAAAAPGGAMAASAAATHPPRAPAVAMAASRPLGTAHPQRVPPPAPPRNARCDSSFGFFISSTGGPRIVAERNIPFCIKGTVVTRFHGSRAAGCAAHGLCGYRGSVTWRPRGGELAALEYATRPRRTWRTAFAIGEARPYVTVARIAGGHVVATCRDRAAGQEGISAETPVRNGRAAIRLASGGTNQWDDPCAGPVHATLPRLPAVHLSLAQMLDGVAGSTVVSRQRFAGAGWAGTVSEHLSFSAGPSENDSAGGPGPRPPLKRERVVTVRYRASFTTATLGVDWSHVRAGCPLLDACGLRGSERLRVVRGNAGILELHAYGPADRPERDFLTALGVDRGGDAGGITINALDLVGAPLRTTAVTSQDGARCRGTGGGSLGLYATSAHGRLSFHALGAGDTDPSRTSCPGPVLAGRQLAAARPAPGVFASRHVTLSFPRATRALHDGGFELSVHPRLRLALTRAGISNRILTYAAGASRATQAAQLAQR